MTWKMLRGLARRLRARLEAMQNMHPQLGAAVTDYSSFAEEPWQQVLRSLYPIAGWSSTANAPRHRGRGARLSRRHQGCG